MAKQCQDRLDKHWKSGEPVRVVIGLLSPAELQASSASGLKNRLTTFDNFRWVVYWNNYRFPESGNLRGSLKDFAALIDRIGANALDLTGAIDLIKFTIEQQAVNLGSN